MLIGIVLFVVWAAMIAIWDCRARRIPNALVFVGFTAALGCALAHANPFGVALPQSAKGAVLGLLALSPFFVLRVMGAADVKVFAVLGAWCGPSALLGLWVAASLAAGVHALALLIAARTPVALWRNGQPTFAVGKRRATPYAAMLAGAATIFLFSHLASGAGR
ncbi:MAG TPA: prepilin peptidase [Trinickia sp.]|jgi:prepilin peptidase CpaA|nr:prepilin peptidase [Trinickia sp.]